MDISNRLSPLAIEAAHRSDRAALEDLLATSFTQSHSFGIKSFPSYVIVTDHIHALECSYDGRRLVQSIQGALTNGELERPSIKNLIGMIFYMGILFMHNGDDLLKYDGLI